MSVSVIEALLADYKAKEEEIARKAAEILKLKQENEELNNAVKLLHTVLATIRGAIPAEVIQTESPISFHLMPQYKSFKEMVESGPVSGPSFTLRSGMQIERNRHEQLSAEFDEKARNEVGLCVICPQCGGSSASFCQCARERYISKNL
jgi:hypothetical protein